MNARDLSRLRAALWLATLAGLGSPVFAQLRAPGAPAGVSRPGPSVTAPAAPTTSAVRSADYIVAVVNSEPITNNELRARLARVQGQGAGASRTELLRGVLERLINERAQLQLARENGVRVDESMIDAAEQNVARQNQLDVPEFRRRLAAEGLSLPAFRAELRDQLLLSRLREREVDSRVKVSEQEVDQFIREQRNATSPASTELNLAHVLVAAPEDAAPALVSELRAKAVRVQERARAGEDFAGLARQFSDAAGAAETGGVIGRRTADRLPPLFVEATAQLKTGEVSDVIRSGAGFHVVKVLEKRQGVIPGTSVVQNRVRHILLRPSPQLNESAARAQLADFRRRILAGEADFAQLAREYSQDASAAQGGDLGWAGPGMFVPEFEDVMSSLSPGQIAEPTLSRFGLHLIQLVDRRQQTLGEREQREVARNLLRERKLDEAFTQWAQDVRGRAYVEMREPPQ